MGTWRTECQANAELRCTLRDAVSDDAEDAGQRERQRHGREHPKQYGEEPLAAVLCVTLDRVVEGEGAVEGAVGYLLIGRDGCNGSAQGVQIGEGFALGAGER